MAGSNGGQGPNGQQGAAEARGPITGQQMELAVPGEPEMKSSNRLTELGMRIFLDRYSLKDPTKATLRVGDKVLVVANHDTGQRELGVVDGLVGNDVRVALEDGSILTRSRSAVDKPVELAPEEMMERVARGIAGVEAPEVRAVWEQEFRWLLEGFKFVPGGRILAAAGTDQQLSFYNCYVVPSPRDSRAGIVETLSQMMEIMSRGGGVGINVSSLRPRYAYVAGVNGRSSGSVSWGALYSFVTGLIEQGGCFGPDVRIATDQGLIPAKELADRVEAGEWICASTHQGFHRITKAFRNGVKTLWKVVTDRGVSVEITPDHKVAILKGSEIETVPIRDVKEGDEVLTLLGDGPNFELRYPTLEPVRYERSIMSTTLNEDVLIPSIMSESLAYFLGYLYADGYVHVGKKVTWSAPKALKLAVPTDRPEIVQVLKDTVQTLFGLEPKVEPGDGACVNVAIHSRLIVEWLAQNEMLKPKAAEVRVPEVIFRSPASVMGAFVAGYFDADGCDRTSKGGYGIDSISLGMVQDLQQLLAFNGIASHIGCSDRSKLGWQNIYRLCVTGAEFKARMSRFMPYSLKNEWIPGLRNHSNSYPVEVWKSLKVPSASRYHSGLVDLTKGRISYRALSRIRERLLADGKDDWASRVEELLKTLPDRIAKIEPLSESEVFDFEVDKVHLLSGGGLYTSNSRRGALMLILGCWHPDVEEFIRSKTVMGRITNANISIAVTDAFMDAVREDGDWDLEFPETSYPEFENLWDGNLDAWKKAGRPVHVYRTVKARELWDGIVKSAWASAEPGLYFIDRANKNSNSWYYPEGYLACTNPCGEQPLSPFAVCNLGAINLARFAKEGKVYWGELSRATRAAVRFLDNVIDATPYFLEENRKQQLSERRIGLGVMGLAEMLIRLGLRYGSEKSVEFIDQLMEFMAHEAYMASADFAAEKGAFPKFDAEKFLESGYMQAMPEDVRAAVAEKGCRNVTLLTVAPTGTTGTMVNTSTGVEPFFFWSFMRNSRLGKHEEKVAVAEEWQQAHPGQALPDHFVTAMDLLPEEHVRIQATVQRWVDSAISKTCNVPESYTVEQTRKLYELMYELGSKGGTVYRDNSRDTQVLELKKEDKPKAAVANLAPMPKVRPRPYKCHGVTVSVPTPAGTAHITMNDDDAGLPFEIFVEIGKAGSDLKAMAEAMGRLMSLVLRIASPLTPAERIEQIVTQLSGIGGARSYGFGKNRVLSLPDAVAHSLAEHYGIPAQNGNGGYSVVPESEQLPAGPTQLKLPEASSGGDLCPSCGNSTFVREAGCVRCYACGHSEC